jgi:hypothetical protein
MNDSMTGYGDITFYIDVLTNDGVGHDFNSAMVYEITIIYYDFVY